jgi:hypothetical protein
LLSSGIKCHFGKIDVGLLGVCCAFGINRLFFQESVLIFSFQVFFVELRVLPLLDRHSTS